MQKQPQTVTFLIIGCGNRGETYARYALEHPSLASIVGLADPRPALRARLSSQHSTIDLAKVFSDYRSLLTHPKLADAVIIALPDSLHAEAAISLANKGYHILLEKPMAISLDECLRIRQACRDNPGTINAVCHVLRYLPQCVKIKELIEKGVIGDVVNINHVEPVGYWHFAHSYVRGNWRREQDTAGSLLAKCCHDVDLIVDWMQGARCERVSSFGSLMHFRRENKPEKAGERCLECEVEKDCVFSARKIYLDDKERKPNRWPNDVVLSAEVAKLKPKVGDIEDLFTGKHSETELNELLKQGLENKDTQYGRCVYQCDNDVCDNQVVSLQFSTGASATLTMTAFSKDVCHRKSRIYGTKGELEWDSGTAPDEIRHFDFLSQKGSVYKVTGTGVGSMQGHGGADYWLMKQFVEAVREGDAKRVLTDVERSVRSHLVVFAAEESRKTGGKTVEMKGAFEIL